MGLEPIGSSVDGPWGKKDKINKYKFLKGGGEEDFTTS